MQTDHAVSDREAQACTVRSRPVRRRSPPEWQEHARELVFRNPGAVIAHADPWTIGMAVLLMVVVAVAAGLGPAYRASWVNPIVALRSE